MIPLKSSKQNSLWREKKLWKIFFINARSSLDSTATFSKGKYYFFSQKYDEISLKRFSLWRKKYFFNSTQTQLLDKLYSFFQQFFRQFSKLRKRENCSICLTSKEASSNIQDDDEILPQNRYLHFYRLWPISHVSNCWKQRRNERITIVTLLSCMLESDKLLVMSIQSIETFAVGVKEECFMLFFKSDVMIGNISLKISS
jgi:hypothetical protein